MQAENQIERELTEMLTAKELLGRAQALEPQLVEWRRTLHRHPEVGFDLTQTKALVKKALTEMGYEPKDCGKAGVIALAGGKKPGKTILLRADMDALPIPEDSGEEFSSEVPGKMHGCGHDMHTAMLLGAAKLLKAHELNSSPESSGMGRASISARSRMVLPGFLPPASAMTPALPQSLGS
jgi:hippurate hydrolase